MERHFVITEIPCETQKGIEEAAMFHHVHVSVMKFGCPNKCYDLGMKMSNKRAYRVTVVDIIPPPLNGGRINLFNNLAS